MSVLTEAPPPATEVDPRIRARRIAVRRDEGRQRLRRVSILGVVLAVVLGVYGVVHSPILDVDRIVVVGNSHTDGASVLRASGIHRHRAVVDVDESKAQTGIEALPWIATAIVSRQFPGTVRITVTERTVVGAAAGRNGTIALVDRASRVLSEVAAVPEGILVLDGVSAPGGPGTQAEGDLGDVLTVASQVPPSVRAMVAGVRRTATGLELRLRGSGIVLLGSASELPAKLLATATVLQQVKLDNPNLAVLDVRVPSAPSLTRG